MSFAAAREGKLLGVPHVADPCPMQSLHVNARAQIRLLKRLSTAHDGLGL